MLSITNRELWRRYERTKSGFFQSKYQLYIIVQISTMYIVLLKLIPNCLFGFNASFKLKLEATNWRHQMSRMAKYLFFLLSQLAVKKRTDMLLSGSCQNRSTTVFQQLIQLNWPAASFQKVSWLANQNFFFNFTSCDFLF